MASYSWVLGIRTGYEEEYKRRHDEIWPEMEQMLRDSGIKNYHIFRHGLDLFGYFETDDLDALISFLADHPVNKRWSEYMAPIMKIEIDENTGYPFLLSKQWSLDE